MTPDERRLARHLGLAMSAKLIALAVLWWLFFSASHGPIPDESASTTETIASSPTGGTP